MTKCHENYCEYLLKQDKTNYFRVVVTLDLNAKHGKHLAHKLQISSEFLGWCNPFCGFLAYNKQRVTIYMETIDFPMWNMINFGGACDEK